MDLPFLIAAGLKIAIVIGVVLTFVAYSVYAERRFSAIIQDRVGPNRTGIPLTILGFKKDFALPLGGLTQPLADGLKFILKEDFVPSYVRKGYFWLAPCLTMVPALITVAVVPFGSPMNVEGRTFSLAIADLNIGPLFIFAVASLSVYGITLAGWASNSKYPFFGGVRSCAQMISYEIALGLSIIPVLMMFETLHLGTIVQFQADHGWLLLPLWGEGLSVTRWLMLIPLGIAFFIFTTSIFAETNRMPFDLPECETELVGGYHTEYSSMKFALFFLGEYAAMIIGSCLIVTLFFGGWSIGFGADAWLKDAFPIVSSLIHVGVFLGKVLFFVLFFILIRWTVPRFRYDQLMSLGWVVFFEVALVNIFLAALFLSAEFIPVWVTVLGAVALVIGTLLLIAVAKNATRPAPKPAPVAAA